MREPRSTPRGVLTTLGIAGLAVGFYCPLAIWLAGSGGGDPSPTPDLGAMLVVSLSTLAVAVGAAVVAVIGGGSIAVLATAFPVPFGSLWFGLALVPLLLPDVVMTTVAQAVVGGGPFEFVARGALGAVLLTAWKFSPLALWGIRLQLGAIPRAERDALALLTPRRALAVLGRRAIPSATTAAALITALAFTRLEIPEFAGVESVSVRLLGAFQALENDSEGWVLSAVAALIALPLVVWFARRAAIDSIPARGLTAAPLYHSSKPGLALWALVVAQWIPLFALGRVAFSTPIQPGELELITTDLLRESVRAALVAAAIVAIGYRIAGWVRTAGLFWIAVPLFVPGAVTGLANKAWESWAPFTLFNPEWTAQVPLAFVESPWPMSIAQFARFLGIGVVFGLLARASTPLAERRAATLLVGVRAREAVLWRRAWPVLVAGGAVVFTLVLGEVECAHLLVPAGTLTPVLALYQMLHFRFDEQAARLAITMVGVTTAVAVLLAISGSLFPKAKDR